MKRVLLRDVNIVRFTGLGLAPTPPGFVRHGRYAVREGYALAACPGPAHRDPNAPCQLCDTWRGFVAVKL